VLDVYLAIREMLPINVWLDLKFNSTLPPKLLDPNEQPLKDIQKNFEITIALIPVHLPGIQIAPLNVTLYIGSTKGKEQNLKDGIEALTQVIESHNLGTVYPLMQTRLDVPCNRLEITGRAFSEFGKIGTKTATEISVVRSGSNLMSQVSITGQDFSSINTALTEISDRFSVELHFDISLPQSMILDKFGQQLDRYCTEYSVHILKKPSINPNNKTMVVRGNDKDVSKLLKIRGYILGLIQNPSRLPLDPELLAP